MACNCRSGRSRPRRALAQRRVPDRRPLCSSLESLGNSLTVTISSSGKLFLGPPFSPNLSAGSQISSLNCSGQFARALSSAELKLARIYLVEASKVKFRESLPGPNLKLGYLRELLSTW